VLVSLFRSSTCDAVLMIHTLLQGLLAHMWKQCVKNSLDGGAYSIQFHEYDP
jgi:hypothetical protein